MEELEKKEILETYKWIKIKKYRNDNTLSWEERYRLLEKDKEKQALQDKIKLQDEQWYALQKLKNSQQEQELLDLQIAYDKEYEAALNNAVLQTE